MMGFNRINGLKLRNFGKQRSLRLDATVKRDWKILQVYHRSRNKL